jgi:hypothetical protein
MDYNYFAGLIAGSTVGLVIGTIGATVICAMETRGWRLDEIGRTLRSRLARKRTQFRLRIRFTIK